jgi:hypothetical protein
MQSEMRYPVTTSTSEALRPTDLQVHHVVRRFKHLCHLGRGVSRRFATDTMLRTSPLHILAELCTLCRSDSPAIA